MQNLSLLISLFFLLFSFCFSQNCLNYGLEFKGQDGFFTAIPWYQRSTFSLEFWVLMKEVSATPQVLISGGLFLFGPKQCDVNGWTISKVNETLFFILGGTNICEDEVINTTLPRGTWTHIAVTVGNQATLYKNGVVEMAKTIVGSVNYGNGSSPFKVGMGPDVTSNLKDTTLDEIRFWNYILTSSSIIENYMQSLKRPMPPELLAYWRFNQADSIEDDSLYNRIVEQLNLEVVQNCVVARCLCILDDHCVPNRDLLTCPSTTNVLTTTTTNPSSTATTSSTTSSSEVTSETSTNTTSEKNETSTNPNNGNQIVSTVAVSVLILLFL